MAPRNMEQVALEPKMEKNMKVRFQLKRVKAIKKPKIRDDQQHIREEERKISERYGEIKRQCYDLKEEIEMIKKLTARTHFMVDLMIKILIAEEDGDFIEAAALANFLSEIAAEVIADASLADEEEDEEDP